MYNIQLKANNGRSVTIGKDSLDLFRAGLRGKLYLPDDDLFHDVCKIWNGMINKKPGLVVRCLGVADVIEAIKFARTFKIEIAVKAGGHGVAGHALSDGGLVIDLTEMKGIRVDPGRRTVRAEAGVILGELDHETQAFGLATPLGLVSDTGIAGLTLGGGLGWLARKYGLTVDNLVAADLVTAEGRLINLNEKENDDLFWAIKGGGGNFGVVTSFEYRLHTLGPDIWTIHAVYPLEKAKSVIWFMKEYMAKAPEELGLIAIFWSVPAGPEYPSVLWGKPHILLLGCYHGPFEKGEEIIQPLRELEAPVADRSMPMKFSEFQSSLNGDYPAGRFYYWKSCYLSKLSDELVGILESYIMRCPSPYTTLDLWSLGGAISRAGLTDTPFALRQAPFLLAIEANWEEYGDTASNMAWAKSLFKDVQPFAFKGAYLNFPGLAGEGEEMLEGTFGANYRRLLAVKAKYDPYNLFHNNVNLPVREV